MTRPGPDGFVELSFGLPPWRTGLSGATVSLALPPGSRPVAPPAEATDSVQVEVDDRGDTSIVTFRRAHLPRTHAWIVSAHVPDEALVPALRNPLPVLHKKATPMREEPLPPRRNDWPVVLLLWVAALLVHGAFHSAAAARGVRPRPVVGGPFGVGAACITIACAGAGWLLPDEPFTACLALASLPILLLQRSASPLRWPRATVYRPVTVAERRRATRRWVARDPALLVDATHPLGLAVLGSFVSCAAWLLDYVGGGPPARIVVATSVGLLLVMFLAAPRDRLPSSVEQRLARLVAIARSLDVRAGTPPFAMALEWSPEARAARLRVRPAEGIVGVELVVTIADRPVAAGYEPVPVLVASGALDRSALTRCCERHRLRMRAIGSAAVIEFDDLGLTLAQILPAIERARPQLVAAAAA
jgi:hypothetical protein